MFQADTRYRLTYLLTYSLTYLLQKVHQVNDGDEGDNEFIQNRLKTGNEKS